MVDGLYCEMCERTKRENAAPTGLCEMDEKHGMGVAQGAIKHGDRLQIVMPCIFME